MNSHFQNVESLNSFYLFSFLRAYEPPTLTDADTSVRHFLFYTGNWVLTTSSTNTDLVV